MSKDSSTELRRAAMDFLARREHARFELQAKLSKKFPEAEAGLLASVLDQLETDKLLSDERFTEAYVRYRKARGYGPLFIRQHLQQCRVAPHIISTHLQINGSDWLETLQRLLLKKTPIKAAPSAEEDQHNAPAKEQLKLRRFLLARGFTPEQIANLWR